MMWNFCFFFFWQTKVKHSNKQNWHTVPCIWSPLCRICILYLPGIFGLIFTDLDPSELFLIWQLTLFPWGSVHLTFSLPEKKQSKKRNLNWITKSCSTYILCYPFLDLLYVRKDTMQYDISRPDQRWPLPLKHARDKNSVHLFVPLVVKMRNLQIFITEWRGSMWTLVCHFSRYINGTGR